MSDDWVDANRTDAGRHWAEQLLSWAVPDEILAQAPVPPWVHDVASFAVDDALDRDTTSARLEREVLPATGGTVLDIGCGGGRASLALVPPAASITGVDENERMLASFGVAATAAGVRHATVVGRWPDVAPSAPVADLVVCHHVLYNVADVEPFVLALTAHARLAVVVEIPPFHPQAAWAEGWRHFWRIERPDGPTDTDLVAVLRALDLEPEVVHGPRPSLARAATDPAGQVESARRRLCLTPDRDPEIAAFLAEHPPAWADTFTTIRWPGAATPT